MQKKNKQDKKILLSQLKVGDLVLDRSNEMKLNIQINHTSGVAFCPDKFSTNTNVGIVTKIRKPKLDKATFDIIFFDGSVGSYYFMWEPVNRFAILASSNK